MNKEDLLKRIEATKEKIEKMQRLLDKNMAKIPAEYIKYTDGKQYSFRDLRALDLPYDIESDIDSCRRKKSQIEDAKATLAKYEDKLQKLQTFHEEEKIKPIWDFLLRWKEGTFNFVKENAELLYSLRNAYEEAFETYKSKHPEEFSGGDWKTEYHREMAFQHTYYAPIHKLTYDVYTRKGEVDEKRLNNILDRDIESKYKHILTKVKKVCGEVVDASHLSIGNDGTINGIIKGTEGSAYVETIVAGGYNQNVIVNTRHGQIAHYRVLVHKIK